MPKTIPAALPQRLALWGLIPGLVIAVGVSGLTGLGVFVLLLSIGLLWWSREAPVLPLCLSYQWVGVMMGYVFWEATGVFPGMWVGDVEQAVLLSLLGLVALSLGILAGEAAERELNPRHFPPLPVLYDVRRIFFWAVASTLVMWALDLRPMEVFFEGAQVLYRFQELMGLFGVLLLFTVFEQRRGYGYATAFLVISFLVSLGRSGSGFSGPLILLVLVSATYWPAWHWRPAEVRWSRRMGAFSLVSGAGLAVAYLVWEGAVKGIWRPALLSRGFGLSPAERLEWFLRDLGSFVSDFNWTFAAWSLAARASSGVGFFSHVVQRVPELVPHTGGDLTLRALTHVLMPRFFFPGKANLGSDSWLIHRYAGMPAAGAEEGTSIGLGYMAQFYIDFGDLWMFVPLVLYGALIGLLYGLIRRAAPSRLLFMSGATVVFLSHFMTYEGEIAKMLGGLLLSAAAFIVFFAIAGPWLHRYFRAS